MMMGRVRLTLLLSAMYFVAEVIGDGGVGDGCLACINLIDVSENSCSAI